MKKLTADFITVPKNIFGSLSDHFCIDVTS